MRLDNDYAKYKFAREATGGQPIESKRFSAHTALLAKDAEYLTRAGASPYQELFAIVNDWRVALQPSATITISNNSFDFWGGISGSMGTTAIINPTSLRKTTPIIKTSTVEKFMHLVAEWKATRNQLNSGIEMFTNPPYQQIIGMGQEAVPLILKEVEKNLDHWFWALKAITGKDPVPPAHRGRLKLMARDWLNWAKIQGYRW